LDLFGFSQLVASVFLLLQGDPLADAAPGRSIDMGGYELHALERGDGDPTVVYFHGAGNAAAVWLPVMRVLEADARQIAFDDPGAGWSDLGPLNATLRQQAFDAERALAEMSVNGPVILVGHSRGGLVALEFARQFRDRVAAVVLVDSSHPNMMLRFRNPETGEFSWQVVRTRHTGRGVPPVSDIGLPSGLEQQCFTPRRDVSDIVEGWRSDDAELLERAYNLPICQPSGLRTAFADELEYMGQNWTDYVLGEIPLTVLYAAHREYDGDETWSSSALAERSAMLSATLASLSSNARSIPMQGVSHAIHVDAPDRVAAAIREHLN